MNEETQLRGLLQAAVPDDASSLDPQTVSAAARRARHRNRLVGLGAAAATIAVIGAAAVVSTQGPDDDRAADTTETTAPYDAPACPATLPELKDANLQVDDLRGVTSVRLCPDRDSSGLPASLPPELLSGMDALIGDFTALADRLKAIEAFDPGRCAAIDFVATRQSLQFTYSDGSTVLVPTAMCSPITFDDHAVDGGFLADAFLATLDEQRDRVDYTRPYEGPLACGLGISPSPVKPGREHLTSAIACTPDAGALDDSQIAALDDAWQDAGPVPSPGACTGSPDPQSLVVATDRGDVTRLVDSGCGYLYWESPLALDGKAIPITMDQLGLTP